MAVGPTGILPVDWQRYGRKTSFMYLDAQKRVPPFGTAEPSTSNVWLICRRRMNVLRPRAEADKARWQRTQSWKPLQEPEEKWKRISTFGFTSGHDPAVNESLHRLDDAGRPFAPFLHLLQISDRHWSGS